MKNTSPLAASMPLITSSWGHHPKISKSRPNDWAKHPSWKVEGHLAGAKSFRTWEEARDYALAEVHLESVAGRCPAAGMACNCTGLCQPRTVWKAVGYP